MSASVFNAYSRYYDLLYRDKDYIAEVDYIDSLLQRHRVNGPQLLEFGSGTGKHGRLLAARGYQVTGIERSADMVAQAGSSDGFRCQVGDICTVQLQRTFDAVLSLFHVVSYQTTNAAVQAVFASAAAHLCRGGLFLFDVWYSPAVYAKKPEVRIKRLENEEARVTRIAEPVLVPNENRVDVHYNIFAEERGTGTVHTLSEIHPMRHFSLPELQLFSQGAGFEVLMSEAFLSGDVPSEETWGVCMVLRKL